MSEDVKIWYRSSLYKGKSYSLHLKCTSKELAEQFIGCTALTSREELPTIGSKIELLNTGFVDGIATRVVEAVTPLILAIREQEGVKFKLIDAIEKLFGIREHSGAYQTVLDITNQVSNIIRHNIHYMICLTPDMREDQPIDKILHKGRVEKKQVVLPIGNYEFTIKDESSRTEDQSYKPRYRRDKPSLTTVVNSASGTFTVYRTVDSMGRVMNSLTMNTKLDTLEKNKWGYDMTMDGFMEKGHPIFADTWSCIAIQMEGIMRLACTFIRTRQLPNRYNRTPRPKKVSKKPRIVRFYLLQHMRHIVADILKTDLKKKIKTKLPSFLKLDMSTVFPIEYRHQYCYSTDKMDHSAGALLAFWELLNKKQRKAALMRFAQADWFKTEVITNPIGWEKHEHDWVKQIYTDIVLPASKLKPKEVSHVKESVSSSVSSAEGNPNSSSGSDGQANRVVLRTARGNESFSCGESPSEDSGASLDGDNQSPQGSGDSQNTEVQVALRLGSCARED